MNKKVTVILEDDLDKQTVNISDEHKVGSMFLLTPQEVTIPGNQISNLQNLIFRKSKNSNYPMFCTGFQHNKEWYGDRPDDGVWINPFENMQKYQRTGETDVPYTPTQEDKPHRFIVKETYSGVQVILESIYDYIGVIPTLTDVTYNGNNLGEVSAWEASPDHTIFTVQTGTTVLSYQNSAVLEFTYYYGRYRVILPKVADEGGAGTFAVELARHYRLHTLITMGDSPFIQIS